MIHIKSLINNYTIKALRRQLHKENRISLQLSKGCKTLYTNHYNNVVLPLHQQLKENEK